VRVAAVDIGTNSTRLLVADSATAGSPTSTRDAVTRLGEGSTKRRRLLPCRSRACATRSPTTGARSKRSDAERTLAIATSAIRDAENGEAFLGEIEWSYGFARGCSPATTRR
jgi:exopolyphosphatase/guanosine-5'-triphosphate,3'-diphosphate pyrophosphatase